ncbi:MBL fold metallo-hydrolase, partial [Streptomyces sp. McG3]
PTRVDREVTGGEVLPFGNGARVVHAPGHTAGSIALHLPRHGVLFTGDTVASAERRVVLGVFNVDRAGAATTFRRLAALSPRTVCFGHGDPLTENAAAAMDTAANGA